MSAREILLEEIQHQPEPVQREVLLYLNFLSRRHEEAAWTDVLPSREVEQEVLDLLDRKRTPGMAERVLVGSRKGRV